MDDRQVEDLLKRYRPSGPPESLRARCLAPSRQRRAWPWAVAAAALLVITFALEGAAANAVAGADVVVSPDPMVRAVLELAEVLGGDAVAQRAAEEIIVEQMLRDREKVAGSMPPAGEVP